MSLTDDQRKHLEFIQAVISRLSGASVSAKGWSLTIAGAAFGLSTLNQRWYLSLLGVGVVLLFSVLDMNYLFEERLFRRLYDDARKGNVEAYSMDKDVYRSVESRKKTYFSWAVSGFYFGLLVAGGTVTAIAI